MTPIQDRFSELLESLIEGSTSREDRAELLEILRDRPDLLPVVSRHLEISGALSELGKPESDFVGHTAAHVARIADEEDHAFARGFRRRIVRRRVLVGLTGLAAAAVVGLALLPLFRKPAVAPQTVATLLVSDADGKVVATKELMAGTRIKEDFGLMRLNFQNGAVLGIEAPVSLTIVSENEVRLDLGRVNAWCPESAYGFKVSTATAAATDLGTSFGVSASADGQSEFLVLDGLVEVEDHSKRIRLEEGDALSSGHQQGLTPTDFNPSAFSNTWPLAHGILSTRGAVIPANPDTPERLLSLEDDDHVLVIPERREVPFDRRIYAEVVAPGSMPGDFNGKVHTLSPVLGKRLSGFQIRYNPVGEFGEENFLRFEGEVTFDRPVLAISCQTPALESGDGMFATGKWKGDLRGIELEQISNPPDSVTLSEDRHTVKVVFYAGRYTDAIRVIVEDN